MNIIKLDAIDSTNDYLKTLLSKMSVKNFTIVPDLTRDFVFNLPQTLEKGKYLAIGVLDYESSEEIQAAKLEFEIN